MRNFLLACAALGAAASLASPRPAHACGGFFCSSSMPVDQSGENIVFATGPDGTLETHVQIFYAGAAPRFAWIVPVPSIPEIALGTNALFTELDRATAPQFTTSSGTEGTCRPRPTCNYPRSCPRTDVYDASAPYPAPGARDAGAAPAPPPPVSVHLQQSIGAFDAVVLSATDATALHTWLQENEYDIPENAIPLLDTYVALGDHFVALKLQSGAMTGEIQPIVLRYREDEPCIPIRLTAISTVADLPIRAYVLAPSFVTPRNYSFIDPPEHAGLWLGYANYGDLVTRAVDDAGGRAFVTEFAGAPPRLSLSLPSIEDLREASTPAELVRGLRDRGYAGDAQLLAVLQRIVPPPPGQDAASYYNCLVSWGCDEGYVPPGWSASESVDVLNEMIVEPRANAEALLRRHPRLTRLFTTMSGNEMTVDPVFRFDDGMAEVSNVRRARLVTECAREFFEDQAPQRLEMPSGALVRVREGYSDARDDETICRASGGTTGTPPAPRCSGSPPGSSTEPGGVSYGGGGGCSVSGRSASGATSLVVLVGLALLGARRRRRTRR